MKRIALSRSPLSLSLSLSLFLSRASRTGFPNWFTNIHSRVNCAIRYAISFRHVYPIMYPYMYPYMCARTCTHACVWTNESMNRETMDRCDRPASGQFVGSYASWTRGPRETKRKNGCVQAIFNQRERSLYGRQAFLHLSDQSNRSKINDAISIIMPFRHFKDSFSFRSYHQHHVYFIHGVYEILRMYLYALIFLHTKLLPFSAVSCVSPIRPWMNMDRSPLFAIGNETETRSTPTVIHCYATRRGARVRLALLRTIKSSLKLNWRGYRRGIHSIDVY